MEGGRVHGGCFFWQVWFPRDLLPKETSKTDDFPALLQKVWFPRDLFLHVRIVSFATSPYSTLTDREQVSAVAIGSVYPVMREIDSATDSRRTTQGLRVGNSKNR